MSFIDCPTRGNIKSKKSEQAYCISDFTLYLYRPFQEHISIIVHTYKKKDRTATVSNGGCNARGLSLCYARSLLKMSYNILQAHLLYLFNRNTHSSNWILDFMDLKYTHVQSFSIKITHMGHWPSSYDQRMLFVVPCPTMI